MSSSEKLVFMVTHGPVQPELATIPFVMAGAALASDVAVVLGFQGDGVRLMQTGVAETVERRRVPAAGQAARRRPRPGRRCSSSAAPASRAAASRPRTTSSPGPRWSPPAASSPRSPPPPTRSCTRKEPTHDRNRRRARGHRGRQGHRRPRRRLPGPLLEAKKGMSGVTVGSVIEIWSTDPGTKTDIAAWSGKVGHDFMGVIAGRRLRPRLRHPPQVVPPSCPRGAVPRAVPRGLPSAAGASCR